MPAGVGYPDGGVGELAGAGASLGIPQSGAVPGGGGLEDILSALTSGQMSPETLLALLALLSGGGGVPGQLPGGPSPAGGPVAGDPIAAALGGGGGGLPPGGPGGFPPL